MSNEQGLEGMLVAEMAKHGVSLSFDGQILAVADGLAIRPENVPDIDGISGRKLYAKLGRIATPTKREIYLVLHAEQNPPWAMEHIADIYPSEYGNGFPILEAALLNLRLFASKANGVRARLPQDLRESLSYCLFDDVMNDGYSRFRNCPTVKLVAKDPREVIPDLRAMKITPGVPTYS